MKDLNVGPSVFWHNSIENAADTSEIEKSRLFPPDNFTGDDEMDHSVTADFVVDNKTDGGKEFAVGVPVILLIKYFGYLTPNEGPFLKADTTIARNANDFKVGFIVQY